MLRAQGSGGRLELAGIHGTKHQMTEATSSGSIGFSFQGGFCRSVCIPVNLIGKHKKQLQQADAKLQSIERFKE